MTSSRPHLFRLCPLHNVRTQLANCQRTGCLVLTLDNELTFSWLTALSYTNYRALHFPSARFLILLIQIHTCELLWHHQQQQQQLQRQQQQHHRLRVTNVAKGFCVIEKLAGFLDPNDKTGVEREFVTCMDYQLLIELQKSLHIYIDIYVYAYK